MEKNCLRCSHYAVCLKLFYGRQDKEVKTPEAFDKLVKEFAEDCEFYTPPPRRKKAEEN